MTDAFSLFLTEPVKGSGGPLARLALFRQDSSWSGAGKRKARPNAARRAAKVALLFSLILSRSRNTSVWFIINKPLFGEIG